MRINLFLFIIFFSSLNVFGQNESSNTVKILNNDYKWNDNRIGASLSMMTGYGLSYSRKINENMYIKTQLFAYGSLEDDTFYENEIDVAFGLELQYDLKKYEMIRLYALGGGFYNYNKRNETVYFEQGPGSFIIANSNHFGLGFGVELLVLNQISFAVDGGYYLRFTSTNEEFKVDGVKNSNPIIQSKSIEFGLGVGLSAFYSF